MVAFFDPRTLSLCNAFVGLVFAVCLIAVSSSRKTYPGFLRWTIAAATGGVGAALLALPTVIPDWVSILGGNAMVVASAGLILDGIRTFGGRRPIGWLHATVGTVFTIPMVIFTLGPKSIEARIIVDAVTAILYFAPALREVVIVIGPKYGRNRLLAAALGIQLLWSLMRIIASAANLMGSRTTISPELSVSVSEALFLATYLAVFIGLLALNFQRTEDELRASRSEVSTLRGIIPICASCKRIRDDAGYWKAVEEYVSAHTEAEFTHGICPDCRKKLYPSEP